MQALIKKVLTLSVVYWRIAAIVVGLAIFYLSIIKAPTINISGNWFWDNIDKTGHGLAYCSFAFFVMMAFQRHHKVKLAFFAWIYGLILECGQYFIPMRYFDLWDMLANLIGVIFAYFLIVYFD